MSICPTITPPSTTATNHPLASQRSITFAKATRVLPLVLAALLVALGSPAQAQDDKNTKRQQEMEERRAERMAKAQERREQLQDPEFVRKSAWWNQERNIADLSLSASQRSTADAALVRFVNSGQERQEASHATQKAFFDALGTGATAAELAPKRDAMLGAMGAHSRANAELRIEVMTALTAEQRTKIATDKVRLLRADWGGKRSPLRQQRPASGANPKN